MYKPECVISYLIKLYLYQIPGGKKGKRRPLTTRPHVEKFEGSGSANVILYVGLGMVCIGLVITFVGIGDKGFQTLELKLIGPSLVGCGVFFALLRILFCTVPACFSGLFGSWPKFPIKFQFQSNDQDVVAERRRISKSCWMSLRPT